MSQIITTIRSAYRSAFQIPAAHPLLVALTAVALIMATATPWLLAMLGLGHWRFQWWHFTIISPILQTSVTAPLQVAGYRLLLMENRNERWWSGGTLAFFALTALVSGTTLLGAQLRLVLGSVGSIAVLAIYYFYYRLVLALPAMAIGASRAPFRLSWNATAGRFWFVFMVTAAAVVPIIVVSCLMLVAGQMSVFGGPTTLSAAVVQACVSVVATLLVVGAIAAVYRGLVKEHLATP